MINLNNMIKKVGLICGVSITRLTPFKKLKILINKLHPISTSHKLVRIGPNGNGGYLLPDDFDNIEACFSPGVGSSSGFELDCAKMGMNVFLADKSVDEPTSFHEKFVFKKKYIGATMSDDFMTMDEWVKQSGISIDSDLLLQMDIEGYEYETILSISNDLMQRFRIIVIEFHQLELLFSNPFFEKILPVFEKILQSHVCIHIHPNNCCAIVKKDDIEIPPVMEFTFIRKDRVSKQTYSSSFPHLFDFDSAQGSSIVLPKCWYKYN